MAELEYYAHTYGRRWAGLCIDSWVRSISHLTPSDLLALRAVCGFFREVVIDETLWRRLCIRLARRQGVVFSRSWVATVIKQVSTTHDEPALDHLTALANTHAPPSLAVDPTSPHYASAVTRARAPTVSEFHATFDCASRPVVLEGVVESCFADWRSAWQVRDALFRTTPRAGRTQA